MTHRPQSARVIGYSVDFSSPVPINQQISSHHLTFSGTTFPGNMLSGKATVEDITETWYKCSGNDFDRTGAQQVTNSQVVVFVSYAAGC
jgi:hypothetical protein